MEHRPTTPRQNEPAILRLVCGWCGAVLRESSPGCTVTSTGICEACSRQFQDPAGAGTGVDGRAAAPDPTLDLVARSRRWSVSRGGKRHMECHIQRVRDFADVVVYEVRVLYEGEPLYVRTFSTSFSAEREADDFLAHVLTAGWFSYSLSE